MLKKDTKGYNTNFTEDDSVEGIEYIDGIKSLPAFTDKDIITVPANTIANITTPVKEHSIRLLANQILLVDPFGSKIKYLGDKLSLSLIEAVVWERGSKDITIEEYLSYANDSVNYITQFSDLFTTAATPKNILPPIGVIKEKNRLLKKYGAKLQDPIEQTRFEKELTDFAREYLKDDPSFGHLLKGKTFNTYIKYNVTYGSAVTFKGYTDHLNQSLSEGIPTDSKTITDQMNNLRYGSFSRAKKTQLGGVVPKYFLGASGQYLITEVDCKTSRGIDIRVVGDLTRYKGYYKKGTTKLIDASKLKAGDALTIRSPTHCASPGDTFCRYCLGDPAGLSGKSVGLLLASLSSKIIKANLKAFHITTLKSKNVDVLNYID